MLSFQHLKRRLKSRCCLAAHPRLAKGRMSKMMRYSLGILLTALAVATALPKSGFAQCADQSRREAETASSPCPAFQERELAAGRALRFVLNNWVGIAYFTSEPGGLRLVATMATGDGTDGTPVRFVATLAPDQMATLSVPRKVGEGSIEVSFLRQGERLLVKTPSNASN
jgi:hypothetical protein